MVVWFSDCRADSKGLGVFRVQGFQGLGFGSQWTIDRLVIRHWGVAFLAHVLPPLESLPVLVEIDPRGTYFLLGGLPHLVLDRIVRQQVKYLCRRWLQSLRIPSRAFVYWNFVSGFATKSEVRVWEFRAGLSPHTHRAVEFSEMQASQNAPQAQGLTKTHSEPQVNMKVLWAVAQTP